MNLSKLEKAAKIFEQLKALDKEILAMNQFAMKVVNRACNLTVKIDLTELDKPIKKEEVFDEYGFIKDRYKNGDCQQDQRPHDLMTSLRSFQIIYDNEAKSTPKVDDSLNYLLTDKETLQVIGIFLSSKEDARKLLIAALQKLNVEI